MYIDPARYSDPLEPTYVRPSNHYELTGPYGNIPPPPPPRQSHRGLLVALVSIVGLLLLFGIVFGAIVRANFQPALAPTPTLTINPNYAADDIYNDMLENNLPINSHYENAAFNLQNTAWGNVDVAWQPTSGILLNDASLGFSDSWPMGLYVFARKDQAYEDIQVVKTNDFQVYALTHGRCLLVADSGFPDFSRYAAVVTQYCI